MELGGGPQIGEVTCGGHPTYHVKLDQIKMRDYMDRRVTSPTWGPPLPCKQALTPSDFFLIPGGKNSATTKNISQVNQSRTIRHLLISLDTPSLPPTTEKKNDMHIIFNFSLEDRNTQKKNKGWGGGG